MYLVRWMPSLQEHINQITDDWPGFAFGVFEPRAEGMALLKLALAAEWPRWTDKQAMASGLMCAECGYDLCNRRDESRLLYNIPLPEQPKKQRLVCGHCCNNGLDEIQRLSALTETLT